MTFGIVNWEKGFAERCALFSYPYREATDVGGFIFVKITSDPAPARRNKKI